ncbi:lysophospholipid acyltransferase LPEAT2 [Populus alba]|uniref:Calcineurin B subunit-related family protein n=2 Tax=Populus TaxID=3689 RepID=A0A4U5MZ66_POPAL|nr:lysophospholipid acyltransferase LPEAT2-like [Populus alba]KAJ7007565.1 lysophospholipid acyltransferase LPEAT2-like [Populus alba x Populus x berolinensis]TKR75290.1 calcineurin B subunit-related family protein [Populus alba]
MANHDLESPLISSQLSDSPHLILSVPDSDFSIQQSNNIHHNHNPSPNPNTSSRNPFEFLGSDGLSVPAPSTLDPFKNDTPYIEGFYELIKIVICLPIAIARLVLFGVCLAIGYVATKIALKGWKDMHNPMPKWRSRLMCVTRGCARCILFSFGYHWITRKGKLAPREIAPIVVSNHVSYIDPIFYFFEFFPTIVAAESHDSMPFVGTIIRAMQVIYVNRFLPSSRKHAVNEVKRKATCDKFPRVLLFPEGTTTNGKVLISFQLGAFIPGYAIQPIIVRYPHVHFDQSWGNISLGMLMFKMFTQFHNFMEVEYLPVVSPLDNCKENPAHFAKRTSHAIASALNVVQTCHSYGDVMLLMKASESKQEKPSSYMVEMAKVESLFHVSSLEAVDFLDKFLSTNPDASGRVKFHDFLRALRVRTCTLSEELFGFLDVEKKGSITFKQFLYGSAHVLKQPLFRQACELAFTECDTGGHGLISEQELGDMIRLAIPNLDEDEIHELFNVFDTDGDGIVSKDSFISCLRRNPLLIALFAPCLVHKDSSQGGYRILEVV